jgi:hypothetical protein
MIPKAALGAERRRTNLRGDGDGRDGRRLTSSTSPIRRLEEVSKR